MRYYLFIITLGFDSLISHSLAIFPSIIGIYCELLLIQSVIDSPMLQLSGFVFSYKVNRGLGCLRSNRHVASLHSNESIGNQDAAWMEPLSVPL